MDKESLVRDIITEDIQKKKDKVKDLDADIEKQREDITKLKEILSGLGILDEGRIIKYKTLQKELEQSEKNLLIFKKNWKGRIEKEKRILETLSSQNKVMLHENHEMTTIINTQLLRLEELRDQEEQFQIMREQKKLDYQSQLEMMLLEREVLERELAYNKMKDGLVSDTKSPSKWGHETSDDLYEEGEKKTMVSKNVGAEGHRGLVEKINSEKSKEYERNQYAS